MADFIRQADRKGAKPLPPAAIIIVCAKYGPHDCNEVDFRTQDVTGLLKAHQAKLQALNPSGPFHVSVSNDSMGGDCAPHLVKTCRVWYQDFADGPLHTRAAAEEGAVVIPPPARTHVEVLDATVSGASGAKDVTAVVRHSVSSSSGMLSLHPTPRALGLPSLPPQQTLRVTYSRYAGGPVRTVEVPVNGGADRPLEIAPLPLAYGLSVSEAMLNSGWTEPVDVTRKVRELMDEDGSRLCLPSLSELHTFPIFSAEPRLTLRYRRYPGASEEEVMEWPPPGQAIPGQAMELKARPEPTPRCLEVVQAIYGGHEKPSGFLLSHKPGPFRSLDVTKTLQEEVSGEGRLRLLVDNCTFGGDPVVGVRKACTVWYRTRPGWPLSQLTVAEGEVLDLQA